MPGLLLATHNRDKLREISAALDGLGLSLLSLADFPSCTPPDETGKTLEENALLKAEAAFRASGVLSAADDTGLFVDVLEGAPGVRSGRYAGESATYRDNCEKLLREMEGKRERGAEFRTVFCLFDGEARYVEGSVRGQITEGRRGGEGFGYDPLFYYAPAGRTFGEMTLEEKNRVSHRGRALRALRKLLEGGV